MPDKPSSIWDNWESQPEGAHIHALGYLSSGYNSLESVLLDAIQTYCDMPDALASFVFEKLATNSRVQLLKKAMSLKVIEPEVKSAVDWFIEGYVICTNNRNLIVHSQVNAYDSKSNALLTSKRSRSDGQEQDRDFSLTVIRRVADEVFEWSRFGALILWYLRRLEIEKHPLPDGYHPVGPNTLPKRPALPADLAHKLPRT